MEPCRCTWGRQAEEELLNQSSIFVKESRVQLNYVQLRQL